MTAISPSVNQAASAVPFAPLTLTQGAAPLVSPGSTSSFIKVYCGEGECVPLSKQCTGGVFLGALADLATSISQQEATSLKHLRRRVLPSVEDDCRLIESSAASGVTEGEYSAPSSNLLQLSDGDGSAKRDGEAPKASAAKTGPSVPASTVSTSVSSIQNTKVSIGSRDARGAPAVPRIPLEVGTEGTSAPPTEVQTARNRRPRAVVYSRAELLPLSFAQDIASNSKVTSLYKQHVQLQGQLRRHQMEQQQLQRPQAGGEGELTMADLKSAGGGPTDAPQSEETANQSDAKEVKAPNSKTGMRRRGPSIGKRMSGSLTNKRASFTVHGSATSAAAAAAMATQTRAQLWTALRNTIPFFGALTMPVHTTMEPLVSVPQLSAVNSAHMTPRLQATTTTAVTQPSPAAKPLVAPSAVCSGSYVLLGCRERSSAMLPSAETTQNASITAAPTLSSYSFSGSYPNAALVDRLMEKAREASVARLPLLPCEPTAPPSGSVVSMGAPNDGARHPSVRPSIPPRDAYTRQHRLPSMLPRCTLHPITNRVVLMTPPLPEDVAAGYGPGRLVTKPLDHGALAEDDVASFSWTKGVDNFDGFESQNRAPSQRPGLYAAGESTQSAEDAARLPFSASSAASLTMGSRRSKNGTKNAPSSTLGQGSRRRKGGATSAMQEEGVGDSDGSSPSLRQRRSDATSGKRSASGEASSLVRALELGSDPLNRTASDTAGLSKGVEADVPLSAAAIARLTPSTRFSVQLSNCSVTLNAQTRKGGGANGMELAQGSPASPGNSGRSGAGAAAGVAGGFSLGGTGATDSCSEELTTVFDGFDVLWRGAHGEEEVLQWVLDEYSILLKQRMADAVAQWTSLVRAGDGASRAGSAQSRGNKVRRQPSKEHSPG